MGGGCPSSVYTTSLQPFKDEAHPSTGPRQITLTLLLVTILLDPGATNGNPHQPVKITWKLQNGLTREVLNLTSGTHPPNTWWPDLYFDLKGVVGPFMVPLLILTFGPCILNKLVTFVKERINTVQLLVLRQQYQALPQNIEEDSSI